jgi:hypothetical protein
MKTNDIHELVSGIAGRGLVLVGLLAVLALAASSFAQSNSAPAHGAEAKATQPAQAALNSSAAPAAKAPRGAGEGIQIHGWWTIEIRNRDGSVAKHVEFENALIGDGPAVLAALLSGNFVAGSWQLIVAGTQSPCSSNPENGCFMVAAGSAVANTFQNCPTAVGVANPQPYCYATLGTSLTGAKTTSFGFSSLTVSAQAYADTSTTISAVQSYIAPCPGQAGESSSETPSACYSALGPVAVQFSEYDFAQPGTACGGAGQPLCPIPVQAGQVIAASVQFSFSSPAGDGQNTALARPHPILRAPASTKPATPTPVTQ